MSIVYKAEKSAVRWFKNGDHPEDACGTFIGSDGQSFQGEGHVVRYYRHPFVSGESTCRHCGVVMHGHGWLDTGGEGRVVCPGDFVVTMGDGDRYPCKSDLWAALHGVVPGAAEPARMV